MPDANAATDTADNTIQSISKAAIGFVLTDMIFMAAPFGGICRI